MKRDRILMCGNEACGEGAIIAGCRFYAGYPITPQNELTAYMAKRMLELDGTFIQAESELAAINMVFGASVAGARAMTSSSSPGISLKQEGISYMAGCGLPAVIVNVMRGGPGLGNIAPSQADYFQATRGGGHGDYRTIVLAPASVQEVIELTCDAFDLADEYRMPAMVLSDGMLGQMMEPVDLAAASKAQAGKKDVEKPWALTGCKGREPNMIRSLLLKSGALEDWNNELYTRYKTIEEKEVRYEALHEAESDLVVIGYGTCGRIAKSCVERARDEGLSVGMIRPITLWPFPKDIVRKAAGKAKAILVVEMSTGQMIEDVKLACGERSRIEFYGRPGGAVPEEDTILKKIRTLVSG